MILFWLMKIDFAKLDCKYASIFFIDNQLSIIQEIFKYPILYSRMSRFVSIF